MHRFLLAISCSLLLAACDKDNDPVTPATANYADSVKNGLWGHYNFNGSFADQSNHNHPMVGFNSIALGVDMWGNENSALDFDGVNDYAVIDSGKNFPEGGFSVAFHMMSRNTYGRVFQKANYNDAKGATITVGFDDAANNNKLVFNITKDNNICNVFTDLSNSTPLYSTKTLYDYSWYHVVATFVNGVEKFYVNGNLLTTQQTPNLTFKNCTTAPFYLGMWWLGDPHQFNGKVDNLRIYTRVLSDKEVDYLYKNQL